MVEAPGIRAWLCRLIQKALQLVLGLQRLDDAIASDESVSIRGSGERDKRQTEDLIATNDPSSSNISIPASDAMASFQNGNPPSVDEAHSNPPSSSYTSRTLRDNIEKAMVHKNAYGLEFVPESALKQLMSDSEALTEVLEELRSEPTSRWETPVEDLVSFIAEYAYKVFAILIREEVPHLIEQFYQHRCDFRQEMLPVKLLKPTSTPHPNVEPYDEVSRRKEGLNCNILGNIFDINSAWNQSTLRNFCLHWQWPFFPPIFVEEQFRYLFPNGTHLPFTENGTRHEDGYSLYSWMDEKSIHSAHIRTTLPLARDKDGNPLVALKMLKSDDSDKADREAVALETINGFKSKHLIKTIAYYQLQSEHQPRNEHYFMFPWAEKGNLWSFWSCHAPGTDRKYVVEFLRQLTGLACALDELSSHHIRHGDLKPENILCFKVEDGLPEGAPHDPEAAVRLVITDVGLARVHVDATSKRGVTDTTVSTMRYASPELGPNYTQKLSRRFDVWSMGCIYLEFLIWVLYGKDELIEFSKAPGDGEAKARFYERTDAGDSQAKPQNLQVPGVETQGTVRVHRAARAWMSRIRADERCSEGTAFRCLLDLISEKLLVVELGNIEPPPDFQAPKEDNRIREELDPDPLMGVPGLRTQSATFPIDKQGDESGGGGKRGRVYAPDMKNGLMEILDGVVDGSIPVKESVLAVRGPSRPKNDKVAYGSVNNRVGG